MEFKDGFKKMVPLGPVFESRPCTITVTEKEVKCSCSGKVDCFSLSEVVDVRSEKKPSGSSELFHVVFTLGANQNYEVSTCNEQTATSLVDAVKKAKAEFHAVAPEKEEDEEARLQQPPPPTEAYAPPRIDFGPQAEPLSCNSGISTAMPKTGFTCSNGSYNISNNYGNSSSTSTSKSPSSNNSFGNNNNCDDDDNEDDYNHACDNPTRYMEQPQKVTLLIRNPDKFDVNK